MNRKIPWTPERLDQLRALATSGVSIRDAAKQLGTTYDATSTAAARYGISFNGNRLWSPEKIEQMRKLAATGLRRREAAAELGITFDALQKAAVRFQVKFQGRADTTNRIKQKWVTYKNPSAPPLGDRSDEIAQYIATRGVTRCPPAYAAPSPQGAVS